VFFALVCAITAAFAVTVSPAEAKNGNRSLGAFCGAASTSQFSSLSRFGATATTARGVSSEQREPGSTETALEVPADGAKGGKNFRATIRVYFHVLHDGAIANLTQNQTDDQIRVMNFGFAGLEGGYDTASASSSPASRAPKTRSGCTSCGDKYEREMERTLHQGGREAVNIYATEASFYLGSAYFPNVSDSRLPSLRSQARQ